MPALESDVRRGCEQVDERPPEPADCPHRTLAVFDGAGIAAVDGDGRPPVQVLRYVRQRRDCAEPDDGAELVRRVGDEVPVEAQHVGGVVGRPEDGPRHHGRAEGMQSEPERGDDAEVAAAASQRPEQIRMVVGGRADDAALGDDHLGSQQIVDDEPVFAHEEADAAAEGDPGDAGVAHDAAGCGETVGLRLVVDVAPQRTTLHPGRAVGWVDQTVRIAERSMTIPPSHTAVPATLWPPPRTAISMSWWRAKRTAAATSAVPLHRAISRGHRSTAPFHTARAVS